jgi:putative ABC transport system ATP-binding protein
MPNHSSAAVIAVEHLSKSVTDSTGTLRILRDIHFSLAPRETVAIVGASGSGKSTLLSIIAGLDTPTQGTVRIAGQDLFALSEDQRAALRAQKMGFVFQSFQLMGNLTALENVMLPLELAGRKDARKAATEMLGRVGLAQRLGHYPKLLSGGEQQRVARRAYRQPGLCHRRDGDGVDVCAEP